MVCLVAARSTRIIQVFLNQSSGAVYKHDFQKKLPAIDGNSTDYAPGWRGGTIIYTAIASIFPFQIVICNVPWKLTSICFPIQ